MRSPKGRLAVVADAILGVVELDAALTRGRMGRPLAADDIQKIRKLRADGLSLRETGRRVGVAANTVRRYLI
jgi:DNA invertase Pin-like site-specific DNA recombinase